MPGETVEKTKESARTAIDNFPVRLLVLLLLLIAAPLHEAFRITAFSNGDIWWHLRTGLWMLQNYAIPRQGLFSQYPEKGWIASSWGFEVLAAQLYKLIGLRAVPVILMGFQLALAAVTFLLAYIGRRNFWVAALLSAAAQYVIVGLQPLPILFSIVFFGIELILLLQSWRTGELRPLLWLPLLFVCWANLHPQFVLGLGLLGLFLLSGAVEHALSGLGARSFVAPSVPLGKCLAVAGISCAATLLTPYSFHLFADVIPTLYSKVGMESFAEMSSLEFRSPQNFVLLLLAMGAFLALGRQRSRDLFKLSVLSIFAMLAFRFQRDAWCVVLPAIAVLADAVPQFQCESHDHAHKWKWGLPLVAAFVLVSLVVAILRMPGNDELQKSTAQVFPLKACEYIRTNQLSGPIFNSYSWGGFLTFYLPEYPVAIDGRLNLYGDDLNENYFKVTAGTIRLENDPSFVRARTILLERKSGMVTALTSLPQLRDKFRVAYEDDVAVVLIRISPDE
jgi:hypothetical protein